MQNMRMVGSFRGQVIEDAGEFRAKITFDPPARAPILGGKHPTKEDAARELHLLARFWEHVFRSAGFGVQEVNVGPCRCHGN